MASAQRNTIFQANQKLVYYFAKRFAPRGILSFADLVQEGGLGLLYAIERFEPQRGLKFSTFAAPYISGYMMTALTRETRHNARKNSLDEPHGKTERSWHEIIPAKIPSQEDLLDRFRSLPSLLDTLPPPEKRTLELLYGLAADHPGRELTCDEAGEVMGVCGGRVFQFKEAAFNKLQRLVCSPVKASPYIKWQPRLSLLKSVLAIADPFEHQLLEMTYIHWQSPKQVAATLGKIPAEIRLARRKLATKLLALYQSLQKDKLIAQPYKTEKVLARLVLLRQRMERGEIAYAKSLEGLSHDLGIVYNTIKKWMACSGKIRTTVKTLFKKEKEPGILPAEKRAEILAEGYHRLVGPDRDLGRKPVLINELAAATSYGLRTVLSWINDDPGIIGKDFIMYLKRGHQAPVILEHRQRRLRWALDFARVQGFRYLKLGEFGRLRLNTDRHTPFDWITEDPEILKIITDYPDVLAPGWRGPEKALAA
jgi:RNA polymerase sigma factor (sigma-70 family)